MTYAPPLRPARLDELAFASPDPARLAAFYGEVMGYAAQGQKDDAIFLRGPDRRLVIERGDARAFSHAAYRLDDETRLNHFRQALNRLGASTSDYGAYGREGFSVEAPGRRRLVFHAGKRDEGLASLLPAARLQHVVFADPDVDALTVFLMKIGFVLSDDVLTEDGALTARFLRSDEEHHSIAAFRADEMRLDHHCYETGSWNDIGAWADHLASRGVGLEWGPGRHGPGDNVFLMFKDPDGNWIEISAELEKVDEDRPVGRWAHEPATLNRWGRAMMRS